MAAKWAHYSFLAQLILLLENGQVLNFMSQLVKMTALLAESGKRLNH